MERLWYLARDEEVFGPVTDAQLAEAVAEGRVLPTDQLNVAGQPDWRFAINVPGLLTPSQPPYEVVENEAAELAPEDAVEVLPEEPVPVKIRVTCLACFREVSVKVLPGAVDAHCPKCHSTIVLEAPVEAPKPSANQAAFAKLESKREFKERMQKKESAARTAAMRDGAVVGGVIGAIIAGNS